MTEKKEEAAADHDQVNEQVELVKKIFKGEVVETRIIQGRKI